MSRISNNLYYVEESLRCDLFVTNSCKLIQHNQHDQRWLSSKKGEEKRQQGTSNTAGVLLKRVYASGKQRTVTRTVFSSNPIF